MTRAKFLISVIVVFTVFLNSGCDRVYRLLQKEGAEERDLLGEIDAMKRNERVAEVQKLLKLYGYRVGTPDGKLGANTREAIEAFQKDNNLKMTRFVDKDTWKKLNTFTDKGLVMEGELNWRGVQQALKNAGYNPGPVDGHAGAKTMESLKRFQKNNKLKPDGKVGMRTLKKLSEYLKQE